MVTKESTERKKIFSWGEEKLDIVILESVVQRFVYMLGRNIMQQIIEAADQEIAEERDRSVFRDKGYRSTVLKTVFGEVEYRRHVYSLCGRKNGGAATIYLLDEAMGLSTVGFFSEGMCRLITEACCTASYRDAAMTVTDMTGLGISHTAAWNVIQNVGEQEQLRVEKLSESAQENCAAGAYQTAILYEEMDGVYLSLQGKDREEHGPSKEMKVSIAYSGIHEDKNKRRKLANKVAHAGFEEAKVFRRHAEGIVADFYDVSSIQRRIFNSDGGSWITRSMVPGCTFQLDQYHRNKAVRTYVSNKDLQSLILGLLNEKRVNDALAVIEASVESTFDLKEQENLKKLYSYFYNNRKNLIPYYRRHKRYPEPNNGQKPARCGSMESNIFTIIVNRMKHNRTCWSIKGANNLAAILSLRHTGRLNEAFGQWKLPDMGKVAETVEFALSASKVEETVGTGYNGYRHINGVDCPPAIRKILSCVPFWSLES